MSTSDYTPMDVTRELLPEKGGVSEGGAKKGAMAGRVVDGSIDSLLPQEALERLQETFMDFQSGSLVQKAASLEKMFQVAVVVQSSCKGRRYLRGKRGTQHRSESAESGSKSGLGTLSRIYSSVRDSVRHGTQLESSPEEYEFAMKCMKWLSEVDTDRRVEYLRSLALMYATSGREEELLELITPHMNVLTSEERAKPKEEQIHLIFSRISTQTAALIPLHEQPVEGARRTQKKRISVDESVSQIRSEQRLRDLLEAFRAGNREEKIAMLTPLRTEIAIVEKEFQGGSKKDKIQKQQKGATPLQKRQHPFLEEAFKEVSSFIEEIISLPTKDENDYQAAKIGLEWFSKVDRPEKFSYLKRLAGLMYEWGRYQDVITLMREYSIFTPSSEWHEKLQSVDPVRDFQKLPFIAANFFEHLAKLPFETIFRTLYAPLSTLPPNGPRETPLTIDEKRKIEALFEYIQGDSRERQCIRKLIEENHGGVLASYVLRLSLARLQGPSCRPMIESLMLLFDRSGAFAVFDHLEASIKSLTALREQLRKVASISSDEPIRARLSIMLAELDSLLPEDPEDPRAKQNSALRLLSGQAASSIEKILADVTEIGADSAVLKRLYEGRIDVDEIYEQLVKNATESLTEIRAFAEKNQELIRYCKQHQVSAASQQSDCLQLFNSVGLYGSEELQALTAVLSENGVSWGPVFDEITQASLLLTRIEGSLTELPAILPGDVLFEDEIRQDRLRGTPEESLSAMPLTLSNMLKIIQTLWRNQSVFSVQPFFTGPLQHAALGVEPGKHIDLKAGSQIHIEPTPYTHLLISNILRPNFLSMLTAEGRKNVEVIFDTSDISELQDRMARFYSQIFRVFVERHSEELEKIELSQWKSFHSMFVSFEDAAWKIMSSPGKLLLAASGYALGCDAQRATAQQWSSLLEWAQGRVADAERVDEARVVSELSVKRMFCSEFVASMLVITFREMDAVLNERLPEGVPKCTFFKDIFPVDTRYDALHPNMLATMLLKSGFFVQAPAHPIAQLLMTEAP